jgi:hypothetical protein
MAFSLRATIARALGPGSAVARLGMLVSASALILPLSGREIWRPVVGQLIAAGDH